MAIPSLLAAAIALHAHVHGQLLRHDALHPLHMLLQVRALGDEFIVGVISNNGDQGYRSPNGPSLMGRHGPSPKKP